MQIMIPEFRFMYSTPDGNLEILDSTGLKNTVPVTRDESLSSEVNHITYINYMESIRTFLLEHLKEFHGLVLEKSQTTAEIRSIDLVAEKRGADYFPASVRVRTLKDEIWFAVNVAMTERGLSRIWQDYELLKSLGSKGENKFLPEVFFINTLQDKSASMVGSPIRMFLAEWFRGYHEFHIANSVKNNQSVFSFWDTDNGYTEFSELVALQLIEKVSYVLGYFFNLDTFQEIYPWHHAAGDFIAKLAPFPDVKLITVRQYESRVSFPDDSHENLNDALLIFLANLTIRARIDRIDGTGEFVWLRGQFVKSIFMGFLKSMMTKEQEKSGSYDFFKKFIKTLGTRTIEDWSQLFIQIIESYDQRAPDFEIIKENLVDHIFDVYQNCQDLMIENKIDIK